ncbi:3-deoxy-D-manno-octulosonic acid transferase [Flavobacterium crassostreae]|uniref:3-deoxy-D-manno-octulosonic acid transferase n=1 Tax=Flavobacterium crassostreae TaxID=1763534 RepID=A0A1B9DXW9_9FLAO|nr:glycosyltransferase N-terminal domain-containing protein [Flavobacterium crassostreae]OCB74526.1 3-deoxy-D-manno-octulosonic acid transferase [Flavobacterium crassostreae]
MFFIYNAFVFLVSKILNIVALCNPKINLFVKGRTVVFKTLEQKIQSNDPTIWFHAASLGEYEQGLPVMEAVKATYPDHKIVLSFFSPSGYEVRKNNSVADATVYLPLDSAQNAKKFLDLVRPEFVFFIKYEYWPNYLNELKKRHIQTYLISGIFRKNQAFFKWYGGFYRKALDAFTYFFVQNESSKKRLLTLGKTNVAVSGDTRFDRVATLLEKNNTLDFIASFKNNALTIVIGSSWPKDENIWVEYINHCPDNVKFIIAPHNIKKDAIAELKTSIQRKTVLFSEKEGKNLAAYNVLLVDTIGLLTKIYSYADIAYVGGGFGNPGVHNILEPATFGVPVLIGPNYAHFAEAVALVNLGGCKSILNLKELQKVVDDLLLNTAYRSETGHICNTFVTMNKGATAIIMKNIDTTHL